MNTLSNALSFVSSSFVELIRLPFRTIGWFFGRIVAAVSLVKKKILGDPQSAPVPEQTLAQRTISSPSTDEASSVFSAPVRAQETPVTDPGSPVNFPGHINIAVFGECVSGKSSIINALRGYDDNDQGEEGVAPVGCIPTREINTDRYQLNQSRYLCELPHMRVICDMAAYARRAGLDHYDALVVVVSASERVSSPRIVQIVEQAKERGIPIFVVRPKLDQVINSCEQMAVTRTVPELCKSLKEPIEKELGVQSENIFICSAWEPGKFDFPALKNVLQQVKKLSAEGRS